MDELFDKIQTAFAHVFAQGMAYQRMLDAQDAHNTESEQVKNLWEEITATLQPAEGERNDN